MSELDSSLEGSLGFSPLKNQALFHRRSCVLMSPGRQLPSHQRSAGGRAGRDGRIRVREEACMLCGNEEVRTTKTIGVFPNQKLWMDKSVRPLLRKIPDWLQRQHHTDKSGQGSSWHHFFAHFDRQHCRAKTGQTQPGQEQALILRHHQVRPPSVTTALLPHPCDHDQQPLKNFYRRTIESILSQCCTVWYFSCTEKNYPGWLTKLRELWGLHSWTWTLCADRLQRKAATISADVTHPGHSLFVPLASGKHYCTLETRATRLKYSFFPMAVATILYLMLFKCLFFLLIAVNI